MRYQTVRRSWLQKLSHAYRLWHYIKGFFSGQYLVCINGRVLPALTLLL